MFQHYSSPCRQWSLCLNLLNCFRSISPHDLMNVSHETRTCVLETVPTKLFREVMGDTCPNLFSFINSSLSSGCVPDHLMIACAQPVLTNLLHQWCTCKVSHRQREHCEQAAITIFALLFSAQCKNVHLLIVPDALSRKRQNRPRNNWKRKPNDRRMQVSLIFLYLSTFKHKITKYIVSC